MTSITQIYRNCRLPVSGLMHMYFGITIMSNPYEDELYIDDQFEFTGSTIKLKANKMATPVLYDNDPSDAYPEREFNWNSGMLRALASSPTCPWVIDGFTYGLFEIRCKMTAPSVNMGDNKMWPAFWLYNGGMELDIFEYHTQDAPYGRNFRNGGIQHLPLVDAHSCGRSYIKEGEFGLFEEFNTYTAVWEPEVTGVHPAQITFFFNGRELWTMQSDLVEDYCAMELLINLAVEEGATGTEGEFEIDYIKVLQKADYSGSYKTTENWANTPLSYSFNTLHKGNTNLNSLSFNPTTNTVFYRGYDDKIHYYIWDIGTSSWQHYYVDQYGQTGTRLVGSDIICSSSNRIFYVGSDQKLQVYNPSGPWYHSWVSTVYYVDDNPNSLAVVDNNNLFFRGTDNKIYYGNYSGGAWSIQILNTGATYLCAGDVESISSSKVYYRGTDGYIHFFKNVGGIWIHDWIESSTAPSSTYINHEPNSLVLLGSDIYFRGTNNKLHKYIYNGTNYDHGVISRKEADFRIKGNMRIGNGNSIYYLGMNDKIQYFTKTGATYTHYNVSNYYLYDPQVYNYFDVSKVDGKVFYPDPSEFIFSYYWTACEVLNPGCKEPEEAQHIFKLPTANLEGEELSILLYPNPASEILYIKMSNSVINGNLIILDLSGKIVYTTPLNNAFASIDISNFKSGLYAILVQSESKVVKEIFVKN